MFGGSFDFSDFHLIRMELTGLVLSPESDGMEIKSFKKLVEILFDFVFLGGFLGHSLVRGPGNSIFLLMYVAL